MTFERRTTVNWVDFLSEVEAWIDPAVERIYAVTDNLSTHSAPDVLLFSLLHPRWEFVACLAGNDARLTSHAPAEVEEERPGHVTPPSGSSRS